MPGTGVQAPLLEPYQPMIQQERKTFSPRLNPLLGPANIQVRLQCFHLPSTQFSSHLLHETARHDLIISILMMLIDR